MDNFSENQEIQLVFPFLNQSPADEAAENGENQAAKPLPKYYESEYIKEDLFED